MESQASFSCSIHDSHSGEGGKGKDLPASGIRGGISTGPGNAICRGPAEFSDLEWDIVGVLVLVRLW